MWASFPRDSEVYGPFPKTGPLPWTGRAWWRIGLSAAPMFHARAELCVKQERVWRRRLEGRSNMRDVDGQFQLSAWPRRYSV